MWVFNGDCFISRRKIRNEHQKNICATGWLCKHGVRRTTAHLFGVHVEWSHHNLSTIIADTSCNVPLVLPRESAKRFGSAPTSIAGLAPSEDPSKKHAPRITSRTTNAELHFYLCSRAGPSDGTRQLGPFGRLSGQVHVFAWKNRPPLDPRPQRKPCHKNLIVNFWGNFELCPLNLWFNCCCILFPTVKVVESRTQFLWTERSFVKFHAGPPLSSRDHGPVLSDNLEKANAFNDVFINQNASTALENFPFGPTTTESLFSVQTVTASEVKSVLKSLPSKISTGVDNISYRLLKEAGQLAKA